MADRMPFNAPECFARLGTHSDATRSICPTGRGLISAVTLVVAICGASFGNVSAQTWRVHCVIGKPERLLDVPATETGLYFPKGVAVNSLSYLYVARMNDNLIRRVDLTTGEIDLFAGTGARGYGGDGGNAARAMLNKPMGIAVHEDSISGVTI